MTPPPHRTLYVELAALKKSLELTGETYADDDLTLAISSASRTVDAVCGRRFSLDAADETRYYTPRRTKVIEIDDLTTLTSAALAGWTGEFATWEVSASGTIDTADYDLLPLNAHEDGEPWTAVRLAAEGLITFVPDVGKLRITGRFGWASVPDSVIQATAMLASRYAKRMREAPFGVAGFGADGVAVRVSTVDPDVKMLLTPYIRATRLA